MKLQSKTICKLLTLVATAGAGLVISFPAKASVQSLEPLNPTGVNLLSQETPPPDAPPPEDTPPADAPPPDAPPVDAPPPPPADVPPPPQSSAPEKGSWACLNNPNSACR